MPTTELPVDNQIPGDRSLGVVIREPAENDLMFRVLVVNWLNVRTKMSVDGLCVRRFTHKKLG